MSATEPVSVFIPAFNAEATIGSVIDRFPAALWQSINRVYIINDGSADRTGQVIGDIARNQPKCVPVQQTRNRGYGETVRNGLQLCSKDGCSYAVCLHADGQYPPESIEAAVTAMRNYGLDLLQGSRIASGTALSGGMPLYKYVAGTLLTMLENRVFGLALTDYHSGFLVYGRRVLETVRFHELSSSFDFDLEVIAAARAASLVIGEIPIPTRYAGEKSYLNPVTYGMRVLGVMVNYCFGGYRRCIKPQSATRS